MSSKLPKVTRRDGRSNMVVYALVAVVFLLAAVVGALLASGDLFSDEPQTDAERDYQLLLEGAKRTPNDPAILMTLAETEWKLGKEEEALDHAKRAAAVAKDEPGYRLRYAGLLLLNEDVAAARTVLEQEIALKTPGDAEPYFLRAQINRAEKKYDDAVADMEKGLGMAPVAADMMILYGDILAEAGKKDEAIKRYNYAWRFLPDDPRIIEGLAALGEKPPASEETTAHGTGE